MRWVALISFGLLGSAALIWGVILFTEHYKLVQNSLSTEGKVIEQSREQNLSGRMVYFPVVEFETMKGETIRFKDSDSGEGKPVIETGTIVRVLYIPEEPSTAVIGEFMQFWFPTVVFNIVGIAFLIFGIGTFFAIGKGDAAFEQMDQMMAKERQIMASMVKGDIIRIEGKINRVQELEEKDSGKYVFICRGTKPGEYLPEEFQSEHFTFEQSSEFIGRKVEILIDQSNSKIYKIELGASLLKELQDKRKGH